MELTLAELREGLRNGTLVFCLPAAHADISSDFLDGFSERILKQDWRDVMSGSPSLVASLLSSGDSEDELVGAIRENYGADVSDLPGLPLWEVVRRCAVSVKN